MVVAAVSFPAGLELPGVRDSKKLSAARREAAYSNILERASQWGALAVSAADIDRFNVLHGSLWGMRRVLQKLDPIELALVDGHVVPDRLPVRSRAVVGGDDRSQVIAAASIVAKVLRDRVMKVWDRHYPQYGFADHVGYPTADHLAALKRHGVCPLHRMSFRPVAVAHTQPELPFLFDEA